MSKTILITGSTDGIGLETAVSLHNLGHTLLLHGRNPSKLAKVEQTLSTQANDGRIESYIADLANMAEIEALATAVAARHPTLDILINNAGVFKTNTVTTPTGLDIRFAVNTIAPYLLAICDKSYDQRLDGRKVKNYYVTESVGLAAGTLITALHHCGLASLTHTPSPMGFLNEILDRPKNERALILLIVGYPADDCEIPSKAKEKKSLAEIATFV